MTTRYEGPERREERGWKINKHLDVGHLLTTVALACSIVFWGAQMDSRVAQLEYITKQQADVIGQQRAEVRDSLKAIDGKLDRLVERELARARRAE